MPSTRNTKKRGMPDAPANTSVPNSSSSKECVINDELQGMEKRLMTFIEAMIQPNIQPRFSTFVEARDSWKENEPSPLSMDILAEQMPPNFTEPLLDSYMGSSDPFYHISQFESAISLKNLTGSQKCRLLYTTLKETALQWFSNLPIGSITSYTDFKKQLISRFRIYKKRVRSRMTLFNVKQGPTESLQSYVGRFLQSTMDIHDFNPTIAQLALTDGLRHGTLRSLLAASNPESFDNLLDELYRFMEMGYGDWMPSADGTSQTNEDEKYHPHCDDPRENDGPSQTYTIFIKGLDRSCRLDEIKRKLEEHFGSCGKFTHVSLPTRCTGVSKGFGFIGFEDYNAYCKALSLDGSVLGGFILTVQEQNSGRPETQKWQRP